MGRAVQVENLLAGLRDTSGNPLAGGLVYTYEAGTSTDKSVYTDQNKATAATNPVVLDAYGQAVVYGDGAYKFIVKTSADVPLYTWDNLQYTYPELAAIYAGTSTGSSNDYALAPSPAITSYVDGMTFSFIANHASLAANGAGTIVVSALASKALKLADGSTDLADNDITAGMLCNIQYIASSNHFRLLNTAGTLAVSGGGTGATNATDARVNLGLGPSDDLVFNSISLTEFSSDLIPDTDNTYGIGNTTSPAHLTQVVTRAVRSANVALTIGPTTAHEINLQTFNSTKWQLQSAGHLYPALNATYDIGELSSPTLVRSICVKNLKCTNNDFTIENASVDPIVFKTGGSERVRVGGDEAYLQFFTTLGVQPLAGVGAKIFYDGTSLKVRMPGGGLTTLAS
jgi:hypothetical protein